MVLRTECTDCGRLVGTGAPARRVLSRPVAIRVLRRRPAIRGIKLQKTEYLQHQETREEKRKYGVQ